MIFRACAVFLTRCGVRFRLRTIEYATLNLPCLVSKILAHPTKNHFVRGYNCLREMKRKAHGAQKPRHIKRIVEVASTAQQVGA